MHDASQRNSTHFWIYRFLIYQEARITSHSIPFCRGLNAVVSHVVKLVHQSIQSMTDTKTSRSEPVGLELYEYFLRYHTTFDISILCHISVAIFS